MLWSHLDLSFFEHFITEFGICNWPGICLAFERAVQSWWALSFSDTILCRIGWNQQMDRRIDLIESQSFYWLTRGTTAYRKGGEHCWPVLSYCPTIDSLLANYTNEWPKMCVSQNTKTFRNELLFIYQLEWPSICSIVWNNSRELDVKASIDRSTDGLQWLRWMEWRPRPDSGLLSVYPIIWLHFRANVANILSHFSPESHWEWAKQWVIQWAKRQNRFISFSRSTRFILLCFPFISHGFIA